MGNRLRVNHLINQNQEVLPAKLINRSPEVLQVNLISLNRAEVQAEVILLRKAADRRVQAIREDRQAEVPEVRELQEAPVRAEVLAEAEDNLR